MAITVPICQHLAFPIETNLDGRAKIQAYWNILVWVQLRAIGIQDTSHQCSRTIQIIVEDKKKTLRNCFSVLDMLQNQHTTYSLIMKQDYDSFCISIICHQLYMPIIWNKCTTFVLTETNIDLKLLWCKQSNQSPQWIRQYNLNSVSQTSNSIIDKFYSPNGLLFLTNVTAKSS